MKLNKERILEELNKASNSEFHFETKIEAVVYVPGGKAKTIFLKENETFWLRGNTIRFPLKYIWDRQNRFKNSIPEKFRNNLLIPIHNNENGLTSIMVQEKPFKSIPGLFYVNLNVMAKHGVFTKIPKTFKTEEIKEAAIKVEDKIINRNIKTLKKCIENNNFNITEYFRKYEDDWYIILEEELETVGVSLRKMNMSDNTFNEIQELGLMLQEKALIKLNIDKKTIDELIGDSGTIMININD
uniref:Uncharacterized protein n=1 Tax=viral metagenome TaxID=1070528 RepID=A0A6M3JHZ9_9ZZZZ